MMLKASRLHRIARGLGSTRFGLGTAGLTAVYFALQLARLA